VSFDFRGYDRWITSGRYSKSLGVVTCPDCEEQTPVTAETEYGTTEWTPEACAQCGREFTGDEKWADDEPPEPDYPPDDYEEYGRFEPWA
jgi:hypothetical protein